MPNTCDKYFIIGSGRLQLAGAVGYSVLDLSKPNPFHPGRMGAVWSDADAINAGEEATIAYQMYFNYAGITHPPVGEYTCQLGLINDPPFSDEDFNAQLKVMDSSDPTRPGILLVRTQSKLFAADITEHGILNYHSLRTLFTSPYDNGLTFSGQMDIAVENAANQTFILAMSLNDDMHPTAMLNRSIELSMLDFNNGQVSNAAIATINTNLYGATQGAGKVHGIAFSSNGHYLYFAQAFAPYIGYVDLTDPTYPVHDLVAELNLTGMAPYGTGQLATNMSPDGTTTAVYFPFAGGMGCLTHVDNPAQLAWIPSVTTGSGSIGAPPNSTFAGTDNPPYNQFLLDLQNFDDQQVANLNRQACCMSNQRIPEANHPATFNGITTYTSPWTPQNNPFSSPVLCTPTGGGSASGYLYFAGDFTVQTGARLYVRDMEWRFAPTARLIIEKGAFVQFDNCLLRGDICNPSRWPGVELRGTPYLAQGYSLYPPDQGHLVLNTSTIQDANVGITAGVKIIPQQGPTTLAYMGGIMETSGSTFLNCRVGVNFYAYQNYNASTGAPLRNRSKFTNTTFKVDAAYIAPFDFNFHAQLWKVDGIPFQACTFENTRTTETNSNQLGKGIYSLDANFIVQAGCTQPPPYGSECSEANAIPCKFYHLDHGIAARNASTTRAFTVDRALFDNNICGVYANSVVGFGVHRSNFILGNSPATNMNNVDEANWNQANRGIYSYQSHGFLVDDNTASIDPNAYAPTEGFVTGYSGGHNDMVFRNHAIGLESGYVGEGICADINNRALVGLTYQCNTNSGNNNDIWDRQVTSPLLISTYPDQTIRTVQGSVPRPADNTFDQTGNGNYDIKNTNYPNNTLGYWWALPEVPYKPIYNTAGVFPSNIDGNGDLLVRPANNCASRNILIPVPPFPLHPQDRQSLINAANTDKVAYGNTRYLYDQLIDGGSTDETVQEIQSTWPDEAWELRQALLGKSPYLSVETLTEMVKKNIMPPAMVAEICIANPDATKKEGFLKWLQYDSPCNMPQYLIDNIEASWEQKTYRTTLEDNMAYHHREMTQALDMALATYQADTLAEQVDSIRATLQVLRTPEARYSEILTYLQQDNYDSAYAVMDRLPVEFKLREKEISEKDRTKQFIGMVQGWRSAGRSDAELEQSDLDALHSLMDGYYDHPANWAQNLLCFGYGDCRSPLSGGNGGAKARRIPVEPAEQIIPALSVFPNPANTFATLAFDLKDMPNKAFLSIRDLAGKEIAQLPVTDAVGQTVWDTRSVAPGAYTIELVNAGVTLGTVKLIVKQ